MIKERAGGVNPEAIPDFSQHQHAHPSMKVAQNTSTDTVTTLQDPITEPPISCKLQDGLETRDAGVSNAIYSVGRPRNR
jgi:hypothetical protein